MGVLSKLSEIEVETSGRLADVIGFIGLIANFPSRFIRDLDRTLGNPAASIDHLAPVVANQVALGGHEVRH